MPVVLRVVVRHAGLARMHVRAAQFFRADHLARRRLDQGRATEKYRPLVFDDDAFIGHRRYVCAARGTGAHDHGKLWDAPRRQVGLIVEDAAEVLPVREDFILFRQKSAARIHQVDARQVVHPGNFLGAQVFLNRQRVIGAALDSGIVSDNHTLTSCDPADAGNDPRARHGIVIHAPGSQLGQFQEGRARVTQVFYPIPRQQFSAGEVFFTGIFITSPGDMTDLGVQVIDQGLHGRGIGLELVGVGFQRGFQDGHINPLNPP